MKTVSYGDPLHSYKVLARPLCFVGLAAKLDGLPHPLHQLIETLLSPNKKTAQAFDSARKKSRGSEKQGVKKLSFT